MSRYRGPVFKKSRRYGFSILESGKEFAKGRKREYAPGQHGQKRTKLSDYGLHMYEKQKLKFTYGLTEKQFRKTFDKSSKLSGIAGTNFLQMLEARFDNIIYRAGLAQTRRQARQLVTHGHFLLNGKKANIPSINVQLGDVIELKEASRKNVQILESIEQRKASDWLTVKEFKITFDRLPERKELHKDINEALIVEYYNK
ncbi:30S ribosomal protein S4 [Mycoplasma phocimorsus]|uniref:Small ribosomal subunit protein uS4 n=1 Tax=Mycoplasma phocimorsus TaxID=3045839 RepID=A0AAJ1PTL9_9MOLU|nr:30S ribosomal protein S4 [Mycoplasma phocimorsus]MDJ1645621.1 30S ribosomal protein S4 [Mycoplasma phocimorsus]MDJ1646133.1 30S ribosomal protein S4 [Mycoplasma phocimorsus]MDJ1647222.1 30S ribosomal protein S4 [Mycoplasma phocimorsus]MDJ1648245.1 30S ribosomal protein S4 [Mycoplasma phocimorsus]MDJ1648837.1 30S ribosomal protein S4 [Mycoplasma phocimorsus]